uniref:Uncharacterized protein n=1 Tax=Anopheles atroparvus TaxID=41427 RepID=A0A182IJ88_ANOAO
MSTAGGLTELSNALAGPNQISDPRAGTSRVSEALAGPSRVSEALAGPSRVSEALAGPRGTSEADSDNAVDVTVVDRLDELERCIAEENQWHKRKMELCEQLFQLRLKHQREMEVFVRRYDEPIHRPEQSTGLPAISKEHERQGILGGAHNTITIRIKQKREYAKIRRADSRSMKASYARITPTKGEGQCRNAPKDCWFLTKDHVILQFVNGLMSDAGSFILTARKLENKKSLFEEPYKSCEMYVYKGLTNSVSEYLVETRLDFIKCKLVAVPTGLLPMHTYGVTSAPLDSCCNARLETGRPIAVDSGSAQSVRQRMYPVARVRARCIQIKLRFSWLGTLDPTTSCCFSEISISKPYRGSPIHNPRQCSSCPLTPLVLRCQPPSSWMVWHSTAYDRSPGCPTLLTAS